MNDIQKIKAKIEKLKSEYNKESDFRTVRGDTAREVLDKLLSFIDTITEEHNEDLEEEIERCWKEMFPNGWSDYTLLTLTYEEHKAFAHHFAEWQKQQMMKDAVEGTVKYEIGSAEIPQCDRRYQVLSDPTPIANAKLGDKVKIIILKLNNNEQDCRTKGFGSISD